jgi:hypothetical protein
VRRLAPHDATVVILSDFDGADETTRRHVAALSAHNSVVAGLVHDPLMSELPAALRMVVTDGELQIMLEDGMRASIVEMSKTRLRDVLAWTPQLGIPVLPVSTTEEVVPQLHRLLGLLPQQTGRSGGRASAGGAHG